MTFFPQCTYRKGSQKKEEKPNSNPKVEEDLEQIKKGCQQRFRSRGAIHGGRVGSNSLQKCTLQNPAGGSIVGKEDGSVGGGS